MTKKIILIWSTLLISCISQSTHNQILHIHHKLKSPLNEELVHISILHFNRQEILSKLILIIQDNTSSFGDEVVYQNTEELLLCSYFTQKWFRKISDLLHDLEGKDLGSNDNDPITLI